MAEVRPDRECLFEFGGDIAGLETVGPKLLSHGLAREVGDVADHSRDGQAYLRPVFLLVVLAAVVMRIAPNRVASDDVEGQRLIRQARRCGQRNHAPNAFRQLCRPGQCLVAANRSTHHRQQAVDSQMIEKPSLHVDHVADGDGGEIAAVRLAGRRMNAARTRGAAAAAEQIGADHEIAVGIDRLARSDNDIPPTGIIFFVVPGDVRIAANGVANEHGIVPRRVQLAIRLVSHCHARQLAPQFEFQRFS